MISKSVALPALEIEAHTSKIITSSEVVLRIFPVPLSFAKPEISMSGSEYRKGYAIDLQKVGQRPGSVFIDY